MQVVAIYHLRYLLRPHPTVLACEAVEYGFFYSHIILLEAKILYFRLQRLLSIRKNNFDFTNMLIHNSYWRREKPARPFGRRTTLLCDIKYLTIAHATAVTLTHHRGDAYTPLR